MRRLARLIANGVDPASTSPMRLLGIHVPGARLVSTWPRLPGCFIDSLRSQEERLGQQLVTAWGRHRDLRQLDAPLPFSWDIQPPCLAVLRDTARLSQRSIARYGVLVPQHGQLGAIPPPPFSERFPLACEVEVRYTPLSGAMPYENKANGCDTPFCDTISKRYCAIGGVSRTGPLSLRTAKKSMTCESCSRRTKIAQQSHDRIVTLHGRRSNI